MKPKLLVIDVAALGWDLLAAGPDDLLPGLRARAIQPVWPAVTCTAQATFRTARPPGEHGMVANGRYFPELAKVMFWEQSARLVAGERIWHTWRQAGRSVGLMFWQQSLGEDADLLLSPAPIHKHHGGMIMDCYGRPADLYPRLIDRAGGRFKLGRYWGPLASPRVGDWIAAATSAVLAEPDLAPDLLLTYLPTLDYDLQRHGPTHAKARASREILAGQLRLLRRAAEQAGYETLIFGDYAIAPCEGPAILPNRALSEAGLLTTRRVGRMRYPDLYAAQAFAMVDHEIAHVYCADADAAGAAADVLGGLDGVAEVLDADAQRRLGLGGTHAGALLIIAEPRRWLAYPWWADRREAPDYARHIDIHNKPGFDPCELLFGWPPPSISLDTARIAGTHGRAGAGRDVACASTLTIPETVTDLQTLSAWLGRWLEENA